MAEVASEAVKAPAHQDIELAPLGVSNQRIESRSFVLWVTVAIVESDEQRLLDLAATHALDLVLCWRTSDLRPAESLVQRLSVHSIELLAVAQSCTSLME